MDLTLKMNHHGDGMSDEQFEELKKKIENGEISDEDIQEWMKNDAD